MDILSAIQHPIKQEFTAFKEYFNAQFSSDIPLLNSAMDSVSGSAGKMMRPILLLLVAKSCGAVSAVTHAAATSLELLHTASLLHDDVVDESPIRRNRPSLNALFNNRVAILTGDYLFSLALNNASKTPTGQRHACSRSRHFENASQNAQNYTQIHSPVTLYIVF